MRIHSVDSDSFVRIRVWFGNLIFKFLSMHISSNYLLDSVLLFSPRKRYVCVSVLSSGVSLSEARGECHRAAQESEQSGVHTPQLPYLLTAAESG